MSRPGYTGERLLRDHFPVEAFAPDLGITRPTLARAFVTTERVQVWVEDPHHRPTLVLDAPVAEQVEPTRNTLMGQLHVVTPDGPVHLTRATGCGCGSSLKALSPPVER